jgi:tRNA (guanine-N7-)-methyltransferase
VSIHKILALFLLKQYQLLLPGMAQKKLIRFKEIKTFSNVLEYPENMQGTWKGFFQNSNPIILELACGKGEYTVGLADLYPGKNFIGVDIKGNRLWAGAKMALNKKISNAAFLRTQIDKIAQYFASDEVEEIWITFPDPFLRKSKARKRLTHPKFLRLYSQFLKPGGRIHLKTDSPDLYHFTKTVIELYHLKTISDIDDVYQNGAITEELKIKTYYESLDIAKSNKVFYLCFALPAIINDSDEKLNAILKTELSV